MCTRFVGYVGPRVSWLPYELTTYKYRGPTGINSGREQIKNYTGTRANMLNGLLSKNWWGAWDDFVLYNVILNVAVRLQTF